MRIQTGEHKLSGDAHTLELIAGDGEDTSQVEAAGKVTVSLPAAAAPGALALDDLTDVDTAGGTEGDVLTQQGDGSFALQAPSGGSQTVLASTPVTLDTTALLALADVPVKVVDAPGTGKIVLPMFAAVQYVPGDTGFAADQPLKFTIGVDGIDTGAGWAGYDAFFQNGVMMATTPAADFNPLVWITGAPPLADWEDTAIYVTVNTNFADGNGALIIIVYYSLLDV